MSDPLPVETEVVVINEQLRIPRAELRYRASRSGGPGGQHVNTSSTRVQLEFDVEQSPALTEEQRARIRTRLANRIAANGVLRLSSSESRSQHQNREDVTARFQQLLAQALHQPRPRKRTKPSRAAKEARLRTKKQRSERKKQRGPIRPED